MIEIIGKSRAFIAGGLCLANVLFVLLSTAVFTPQQSTNERKIRTMRSEINRYQRDLTSILGDFDQLDGQQEIFKYLESKQFFQPDLLMLQNSLMKQIAEDNNVRAEFHVLESRDVPLESLKTINRTLTRALMDVRVEAVDDVDFYSYLNALNERVPGYVQMKSVRIERRMDYSGNVLREILQGKFPVLFEAHYQAYWYFMSGDPSVDEGGVR